MRFISKWGRFGIQIRPLIQESYATGTSRVVQDPVYAMFREGKLLPHERELAVATWTFNGQYQEQDEVTIVPPDYRIGVYDSVEDAIETGRDEATRLEIERVLCDHAERFDDLIVVPQPELMPPWPRYDAYAGTPGALVRKLVDEGHDLEETLAYERAHLNRPKHVDAIEEELATPTREQEEVVPA